MFEARVGTKIKNDLLLRVAKLERSPRVPVWMMRQAGRYLPEYMKIRSQMSFLELCKNPKKAAEVSIQPYEILGVDAIIMFSDILIPLEAMGAALSFDSGKPEFLEPLRNSEQIRKLIVPDFKETCSFVYETLEEIKLRVSNEVPVLGFAGAPWTLASYMIEGGGSKNFEQIKSFMYHQAESMHLLLEKLSEAIAKYLILKLDYGADMLQLFDTWASVLSIEDYKTFALPYQQKIISEIKSKRPGALITLYVNGVGNILDFMIQSGADVLSVDWRVSLKDIRSYTAGKFAIQGNFDPVYLLGPEKEVISRTTRMLEEAGPEPGYIANLGHGILPNVPVTNAKAFIETVQNFRF
jgi:uroporphyrinogen decarboxylase